MKIRARLAYGVVFEVTVPDAFRAFVANPDVLFKQATELARPVFAGALSALTAKLAILGVRVHTEAADLTIQGEDPQP